MDDDEWMDGQEYHNKITFPRISIGYLPAPVRVGLVGRSLGRCRHKDEMSTAYLGR